MKNLLGVYCGIVAATAVLSAQTPQTPSTPTTSSTSTTTRQSQTITMTGCVTPDLTADPTATSTTSHRFILSNIQPSAGASSASNATVTSYLLMPSADVSLSEHLNHKVEVTGTVDQTATTSTTTSQSATPSTTSTTTQRSASATLPSFRVTSVKMLSATCP
jgi:hypothetical protein